jgi:hypothetical protein
VSKFDPNKHLTILQGKSYLEVKWRLVWFREEHPGAHITTEILEHNAAEKWAIIRATVDIPDGGSATGMVIQAPTGIAKDYIANGETSAIGRALAALGFGTQHATELDQGDQIVDSPVALRGPVIGGADPRKADTPRPVTAAEMSGRREPAPINPDAPTEAQMRKLHATARDHNWTPEAVKEVMRDLWQIDSSKALTKYQCGLLIDLIEDRMALTYDATGKARLGAAGPADDGKISLDELPFDPAPVAADN